jgi:hypothetical protein
MTEPVNVQLIQLAGVVVPVVVTGVSTLLGWALWSMRKAYVTKEECDSCRTTINSRLADVEGELENAPSSKDMQAVMLQLSNISGELKAANARAEGQAELLRSVSRQVSMLNDYHVTKGK